MATIYPDHLKREAAFAWLDSKDSGMTKAEIAKRFGISTRTLNRAIEKVLQQGAPKIVDVSVSTSVEENDGEEIEFDFVVLRDILSMVKFVGDSDGEVRDLNKADDEDLFNEVANLLLTENLSAAWEKIVGKSDAIVETIKEYSNGPLTISNGNVYVGGHKVNGEFCLKLVEMHKNQDPRLDAVGKFFLSLSMAPDMSAIEGLLDFLEHIGIQINDDGSFYALKRVRADYTDIYTGLIDNSVGTSPVMPRHLISTDRNDACAPGLHVGGADYVKWYSNSPSTRVMKVLVWPKDVVRVPYDHNAGKLATCGYTVVADVTDEFNSTWGA